MLKLSYEDLTRTRPEYASLNGKARPEQPSGQCPYKLYDATEVFKTPIYKLHGMKSTEIVNTYNKLTDPEFKTMTEEDFVNFLTVAFNVKSPLDVNARLMAEPAGTGLDPDWETRQPSKTSRVQFMPPQAPKTSTKVVPDNVSKQSSMDVDDIESEDAKANAMSFAFAWSTKYCIKTPGNALSLQLKNMRESYLKFYRTSSHALDKFNPSQQWLEGIQTCFNSFPIVRHTLAIYVAVSESFLKGQAKLFNLARYLFFQSLEFMGMHSYVSVVKICNKVAMEPGVLLSWLRMQGVENAIDEIAMIMGKLDNGMIANGEKAERVWKYARLIDEGYFNKLQTTYSADLVSVLAHIEIKLGMADATGYKSPLNIFSLKNNENLLNKGETKASIFLDCLGSTAIHDENASIIDRIDSARNGGINLTERYSASKKQQKRKLSETSEEPVVSEPTVEPPPKAKVVVTKPPINLLPK